MLASAAQPASTARASAAGDPLYRYQWHLSNQGQPVIGDSRPVPGVDMDVDLLHALGIRGRGVRVAVVDNGLEIGHEDLAGNIIPNGSHNFGNGSHDPTPSDRALVTALRWRASSLRLAGMAVAVAALHPRPCWPDSIF